MSAPVSERRRGECGKVVSAGRAELREVLDALDGNVAEVGEVDCGVLVPSCRANSPSNSNEKEGVPLRAGLAARGTAELDHLRVSRSRGSVLSLAALVARGRRGLNPGVRVLGRFPGKLLVLAQV